MKPLRFCVIGCGQVFSKYWVPALRKEEVALSAVISLESKEIFSSSHPNLSDIYFQTNSVKETIKKLCEIEDYDVIALLVPADIRLNYLKEIIDTPKLDGKKIFIEKPFAKTLEVLDEYKKIISDHYKRLHFASKYAIGRADILLEQLINYDEYPLFINAVMIEGTKYFENINTKNEDNPFVKDGPELDIGFHLLNIVAAYFTKKHGNLEEILINKDTVTDFHNIRPHFIPNFGFMAEVSFVLKDGNSIPMYLQVGKADCTNDRHLDFEYKERVISQEYTTLSAMDPVFITSEDNKNLVNVHDKDYLYYSKELHPDIFCKQSKEEQQLMLDITRICLEIKKLRMSRGIHNTFSHIKDL